ncbi:MAG: DUF4185 domain-containing protein [Chloroflexi bacterium]|nr:DUF4185 domain-containing protein [Chloroflexota bacterium]
MDLNTIPFARSSLLEGLIFTGRYRNYTNADTWYPSWASDDHLYSPWTDGYILEEGGRDESFNDDHPAYACNSLDLLGRKAATAQARIIGDDPLNLRIENLKPRIEADPTPYGGRYPCGSLVHDGVWYYGTLCLLADWDARPNDWDWHYLGPFVGFRISRDMGQTWEETPHTPYAPLFDENPYLGPIKIGKPHFVDFGRDMQRSPDGKAYLVAHGSSDPDAKNNWHQGEHIYLLRVTPSIKTINDASAYEFYAGQDDHDTPIWTNDFARIQPLLSWKDNLGCVAATYNPGLDRYLMCVTNPIEMGHYDALFLEAPTLTGPWTWFTYLERFGPEAYFLNFPSKFISDDGLRLWLIYSANWSDRQHSGDPEGSAYALSIHEVVLSRI